MNSSSASPGSEYCSIQISPRSSDDCSIEYGRTLLRAQELLRDLSARCGLSDSAMQSIFADVPLDFTVVISPRLPFGLHRIGMAGVTLCERVWLHSSVGNLSADRLLLLLRHEATHVRQQRAQRFAFYLRYGIGWIAGIVGIVSIALPEDQDIPKFSRWMRAYYAIPVEREAYGEEARARAILGEYERQR